MPLKMNLNLTGETFTDEKHTNAGSAAFQLDHDWFWGGVDLVIRTAAAGGGTLLTEGTDYQLSVPASETDIEQDLTARSGKSVYGIVQIINATYQTGDLYFSGKYIADSIDADDINKPILKGHLYGLELSNNSVDANNDIDVAFGECVDDDADYLMVLAVAAVVSPLLVVTAIATLPLWGATMIALSVGDRYGLR